MTRAFLFLLFLVFSLQAEHIRWYGHYDTAHQQALKEKKPLMVLLVEKDSEDSKRMLMTTLSNQPYIPWINEHFVSVMITRGTPESYPIELLYTLSYPSLFFLTQEELFLADAVIGYVNAEQLAKHLKHLTNLVEK